MDSQNKTQREIKFRYVFQHDETGYITSIVYNLNELDVGGVECLRDMFKQGYSIIKKPQFTDVRDHHGKEIYDGDIVEFGYQDHPKRRKAYVEWNGQCYGLEAFVGDDTSYAPLFTQYTKALEVIGNIYENKELLET